MVEKDYSKQYRPIIYTNLLTSGELNEHLQMIDDEANVLYDRLIEQYKVKRNITKELKEKDQMKWVGLMNNISNIADEIVLLNSGKIVNHGKREEILPLLLTTNRSCSRFRELEGGATKCH